eukprot:1438272-Rhodomonas_salina.1
MPCKVAPQSRFCLLLRTHVITFLLKLIPSPLSALSSLLPPPSFVLRSEHISDILPCGLGRCGEDGVLICCDCCPRAFHEACLCQNASELPDTWQCPECCRLKREVERGCSMETEPERPACVSSARVASALETSSLSSLSSSSSSASSASASASASLKARGEEMEPPRSEHAGPSVAERGHAKHARAEEKTTGRWTGEGHTLWSVEGEDAFGVSSGCREGETLPPHADAASAGAEREKARWRARAAAERRLGLEQERTTAETEEATDGLAGISSVGLSCGSRETTARKTAERRSDGSSDGPYSCSEHADASMEIQGQAERREGERAREDTEAEKEEATRERKD